MKRSMRLSIIAAVLSSLAFGSAFAGSSSNGFHPQDANSAPYIFHTGYYVYNSDTVNTRGVVADLGVLSNVTSSIGPYQVWMQQVNSSQATTCWLTATKVSDGSTFVASFTQSTTGYVHPSLQITGLSGTPTTYAVGVLCGIAARFGGGDTKIFGIQ